MLIFFECWKAYLQNCISSAEWRRKCIYFGFSLPEKW